METVVFVWLALAPVAAAVVVVAAVATSAVQRRFPAVLKIVRCCIIARRPDRFVMSARSILYDETMNSRRFHLTLPSNASWIALLSRLWRSVVLKDASNVETQRRLGKCVCGFLYLFIFSIGL